MVCYRCPIVLSKKLPALLNTASDDAMDFRNSGQYIRVLIYNLWQPWAHLQKAMGSVVGVLRGYVDTVSEGKCGVTLQIVARLAPIARILESNVWQQQRYENVKKARRWAEF